MQKLWKQLASPRHLMVFETAARLGSFTKAAQELNVQQPAVSASIRQLEESLGVALFAREHRKITLTAAGERLLADATRAFEMLDHSVSELRQLSRPDYVTLNASTAFNNYWLMPRLADLQTQHPHIDLRVQSSDREPDLDAENISLAVRRGHGSWPGYESALIAEETIYPVAAPQVMKAAIGLRSLPGLLHQRLIHLEEPVRERPTWEDWFSQFGIKDIMPKGGLRLNDYALVLQAAMAGEGFAFGWQHITDRLIDQGLLAARKDWAWTSGQGFYLVWSSRRTLSEEAALVRDWILSKSYGDVAD
ncbi:Gcv operon activator [Cognatishimia activa]|uniref:Gcv operon activator n=1 Tax=Cognatishimia activa TaxID=1715691 RepID=A0A0P1JCN5_9RHOB|nr:LysR substrate-binding domain-containing protein [Cognatishimia activa]CUK27521.1 Gcv operon activator [Cognatishimia activa]